MRGAPGRSVRRGFEGQQGRRLRINPLGLAPADMPKYAPNWTAKRKHIARGQTTDVMLCNG